MPPFSHLGLLLLRRENPCLTRHSGSARRRFPLTQVALSVDLPGSSVPCRLFPRSGSSEPAPSAPSPNKWESLLNLKHCRLKGDRECPAIEVDTSLAGLRVRRVLDRIASERGLPEAIVLDNGPEFRGRALAAWSEERGVRLEFIQPGKPVQNAYVESFNGRLRDECLNANWFTSLSDARRKVETWRLDYNQQRPHSSLDYLPPAEFAKKAAEMTA